MDSGELGERTVHMHHKTSTQSEGAATNAAQIVGQDHVQPIKYAGYFGKHIFREHNHHADQWDNSGVSRDAPIWITKQI